MKRPYEEGHKQLIVIGLNVREAEHEAIILCNEELGWTRKPKVMPVDYAVERLRGEREADIYVSPRATLARRWLDLRGQLQLCEQYGATVHTLNERDT